MKGLLIAFLILFGFLMLKAKVIIEYRDDVSLCVKVLGIPIRILPAKKKRVKPMSAKKAAKIRQKREKQAEQKRKKAAEKAKKKAEKQKAAAEKKEREKNDPAAKARAEELKRKKKQKAATLGENLDLVKSVLGFFCSRLFLRHLRIDVARIRLTIGTEEASQTAILYGVACQSVAYILAFLNRTTNMHGLKKADIAVIPDFLGEELLIDIKIAFSLRIWHLFHVLFGSLIRFIKNRLRVRKRVEKQYPDAYQKPARTPAIQKKSLDANASDKHTPAAGKTA